MTTVHLLSSTAHLDLRSATTFARSVLAATATARVWAGRGGDETSSLGEFAKPQRHQVELTRMISIVGGIRTNADVLPQSLREFLG